MYNTDRISLLHHHLSATVLMNRHILSVKTFDGRLTLFLFGQENCINCLNLNINFDILM